MSLEIQKRVMSSGQFFLEPRNSKAALLKIEKFFLILEPLTNAH